MGFWKKKKKKAVNLDYENKDLENISSNKIIIKVYKDFGSNISFLKAQYEAIEKRDEYNNLVSINADYGHNQDVDFTIDDVYKNMNIILGFKNKTKEEKIKTLNKKIEKQEKLIKLLDEFVELNSLFNYADESLKLQDLNILKSYIDNHDGSGSYFTIEQGRRIYSFESVDGFLVPIWRGVDTYSQYPDHTRKKKITIQEDTIFNREMQNYKKENKLTTSLVLVIGLNIILFCVLAFIGAKLWGAYQAQDEKLHGEAFKCVEYTSSLNKQIAKMYNIACVQDYIEEKELEEIEIKENTNASAIKDLSP